VKKELFQTMRPIVLVSGADLHEFEED